MVKKIIILAIFSVLIPVTAQNAAAQFSGGTGTSEDPFTVSTINDLNNIRQYLDKNYILLNDIDFSGTEYDISGNKKWIPLGSQSQHDSTFFSGSFDGKGYYIKNTGSSLFGYTAVNSEIQNIGIVNCRIDGAAGLILYNNGRVNNCFTSGEILSDSYTAGGLIALNKEGGVVSDCYSTCTIYAENQNYIGGLIGDNRGEVYKCFATGTISGKEFVGGLVGVNNAYGINIIRQCYATGAVRGISNVGGLIGALFETCSIHSCYATGPVSGDWDAGGLVGRTGFDNGSKGDIINCYSAGMVSLSCGGLLGDAEYGTATHSYWDSVSSGNPCSAGGEGRSTAEMTLKESFPLSRWDFDTIWNIDNGKTYPFLRDMYNAPILYSVPSDTCICINQQFTGMAEAMEMNNGPVQFSLTDEPEGMLIDNNGKITWDANMTGEFTVYVNIENLNIAITKPFKLVCHTMDGDGTSENPFIVTKIDDLHYISRNRIFWDKHFIQTQDINAVSTKKSNNGSGFLPVGYSYYTGKFTGSYNGKGHIIDSLYIKRDTSDYCALFNSTEDAVIESLGVTNVTISGKRYVAGLVACSKSSVIKHCYSTGELNGDDNVGGLFSKNTSDSISHCFSKCRISAGSGTGGLSGVCQQSTIRYCFATASITESQKYSGGLIGISGDCQIDKSYATANIRSDSMCAGGLLGQSRSSRITNAFATGSVNGNMYTGGLIGEIIDSSIIENCFSTCNVSGQKQSGGLIGNADNSEVLSSFWDMQTAEMNESMGGTGKTTEEMKDITTFTDISTPGLDASWDFSMVWTLKPEGNNGYPYLIWKDGVYDGILYKPGNRQAPEIDYTITNNNVTFTILSGFNSSLKLEIYNLQGQLLESHTGKMLPTATKTISCSSHFKSSMAYIYVLKADNKKFCGKVIKLR